MAIGLAGAIAACGDAPAESAAPADFELDPLVVIPAPDGGGEPPWAIVSDVTIASDGSIVIADAMGPGVYRFTADGAFAQRLGRAGQGPGEYRSPVNVLAGADGAVHVWDPGNTRIVSFDLEGASSSLRVASSLLSSERSLYGVGDSLLLVRTHVTGPGLGEGVAGYLAYDLEGTLRDTIAPPWPPRAQQMVGVAGAWEGVVPLTPTDAWIVGPDGVVLASHREQYEVVRMTADGDTLGVIRRDVAPVPVEAGERDAYQAAFEFALRRRFAGWSWPATAGFPDVKPVVAELRSVIGGGFAVLRHGPGVEFPDRRAEGRVHWGEARRVDLYAPGGESLGSFDLPAGESLIQLSSKRVITTQRDALGRTRVHVYALTPRAPG